MTAPIRLGTVRSREERIVAGLMTGTSLDGIDTVICRVGAGTPRLLAVLAAKTLPFPSGLRERLLVAQEADARELARLGQVLGAAYAAAVEQLAAAIGVRVELVGSHGQTVYHEHGVTTLQIGEAALLAERLGCPVVGDFRQNDIAAGGCGAPLVPIVDHWLLRRADAPVTALNLGGISNFTAMARAGVETPSIALDCGPANMVMDGLMARRTRGETPYDGEGRAAARGTVDEALLAVLLDDPVLARPPPRSLGREQFGAAYVEEILARRRPATAQDWDDLLATATELAARCIAQALRAFVPAALQPAELVASGGGVRNNELMRRLRAAVAPVVVVASDERGLSADFKEALAFALLASARIDEVPANLPAATGARRAVLLGKISEC